MLYPLHINTYNNQEQRWHKRSGPIQFRFRLCHATTNPSNFKKKTNNQLMFQNKENHHIASFYSLMFMKTANCQLSCCAKYPLCTKCIICQPCQNVFWVHKQGNKCVLIQATDLCRRKIKPHETVCKHPTIFLQPLLV